MSDDIISFKVLTQNFDARDFNYNERLSRFLELIKIEKPDIVFLQEGNRLIYEKLCREMLLMEYKYELPSNAKTRKTSELIFSKYPISDFQFIYFNKSDESNGLTLCKIDLWGKVVWGCTFQLDQNIPFRKEQIKDFDKLLSNVKGFQNKDGFIFGGDTRILDYQKDIKFPDKYFDTWYEAGTKDEKHTLNHEINLMVSNSSKDRPDRLFYCGKNLICKNHILCGKNSEVTISSHFGVLSEFEFA